jgi:hypothetical protein
MFKRFKEIKEFVNKTTKVTGGRLSKNPGYERGKQTPYAHTTTGKGHYGSPKPLGEPHNTEASGSWDSPKKKDHNMYSDIHKSAYVHEDGVAGGGGAAGSAAGGMVAGVNQTSGSIYKDFNIPYAATQKKKKEDMLRRKRPMMMETLLGFRGFLITEMAQKTTSKTESDDKGKLHELLLAKHLHPDQILPKHHRSESENEEHAGTPEQVHDRLRKKLGENYYKEIERNSKNSAQHTIEHLKNQGILGGNKKIVNVHWTSNRDQPNKPGDHEKTTGIKDVNSNDDLILSIAPKDEKKVHGKNYQHYEEGHQAGINSKVHNKPMENPHKKGTPEYKAWDKGYGHGKQVQFHGISAKYGSNKPNLANPGIGSLEKISGANLKKHQKEHDERMEKLCGETNRSKRHEMYKADLAEIEGAKAKAAKGPKKNPHNPQKKPERYAAWEKGYKHGDLNSASAKKAAKRAAAAEESSLTMRRNMARSIENGLINKKDSELRDIVRNMVSPKTVHGSTIVHTVTNDDGSSHPEIHDQNEMANEHLSQFKNLRVERGNGISAAIYGDHKTKVDKNGNPLRVRVASLGVKGVSGPHKGTAAAVKLG